MTSQTPEQIEAEIAQQREQLAATVSELQTRLDVKAKAKASVAQAKNDPKVLAGAAVLAVVLVGLVVWRVRSHRS